MIKKYLIGTANLLLMLSSKFAFAQTFNNVQIKRDSVIINYPFQNGEFIKFDNYPQSYFLYVYSSYGTRPKDSIPLKISPSKIVVKEVNYIDNNPQKMVSSICYYRFHKKKLMRKFIGYYDNSSQVKSMSYMFDHEQVADETEYYPNGNLKSILRHSKDSLGKTRSRKKNIFFSDDDFLNGITLIQPSALEASINVDKLILEKYPNGKMKKEVKFDNSLKQLCLFRYREDGSVSVKAPLKYGELTQEQLRQYFIKQDIDSNSFIVKMTTQDLKCLWYYDGIYSEYGTNGYETKKLFKNGLQID